MKHARFSDLQRIFKTCASGGVVMMLACFMIIARPGGAREVPAEDIPQVEIPELDIAPAVTSEQVIADADLPDQSAPVFVRARAAVDAVMRAYIFGDWMEFEDQVSADLPERMVFLFETQAAGMRKIPNDFQFFINTVNETKEVLSVSFSWIKKHINWDDANDTRAQGKCEFVFQKTSQGLLLKNVIGDYPF